jgi:hypothetical protein
MRAPAPEMSLNTSIVRASRGLSGIDDMSSV